MSQILLIVHVIISLCIIGLVMMQQGKGADAGAAFGGGGGGASGSLFGASGASTFLSKSTAICAVIFFCTSLGLAFLISNKTAPTDIMDVDSALIDQELSDVPTVDGAPVATDVPAVSDLPATPSAADDMPVIEQIQEVVEDEAAVMIDEQVPVVEEAISEPVQAAETAVEQVEETVDPVLAEELPAVAN